MKQYIVFALCSFYLVAATTVFSDTERRSRIAASRQSSQPVDKTALVNKQAIEVPPSELEAISEETLPPIVSEQRTARQNMYQPLLTQEVKNIDDDSSTPEIVEEPSDEDLAIEQQTTQKAERKEHPQQTTPSKKMYGPKEPTESLVSYGQRQMASPEEQDKSLVFDDKAKRKELKALIAKGVKFFNENDSIDFILNNFCHNNKDFRRGELYLFLYDMKGVCLATGRYKEQIWQNMYKARDKFSVLYVQQMIEKAKQGGGWISYEWKNGTKVTYVTKVSKNGKDYVLSCGYFPFSKESAAVNNVQSAVAIFNREVLKKGVRPESIWGILSYKGSRFVYGDLHVYAVSYKGKIVAHGERSGYIGSDAFSVQDDDGKYINREIIEKLKDADKGIWVTNIINNTTKKTYAEKVTDKNGNKYFIACGYFPEIDKDSVQNLVRKAYVYLKGNGLREAEEINKGSKDYLYGDLNLFLYDLKGNCLIDSANRTNVGKNLLNEQDEDGDLYIQQLIAKATAEGAWVDFRINNSFKSSYVELITLGTGKYVLGSGYFPSSKLETMSLLAKSAASYLRQTPTREEALAEFTKDDSSYNRGDLEIFVTTFDGICLALGPERELIWRQFFWLKDDSGQPVIKIFTEALKDGPGHVTFTRKGGVKTIAYLEEVTKNGQRYIVGSSFNQ